jgi:transketolase
LVSWDILEHQTQEYRDNVLPPSVTTRVAVEQASTLGWERYVGTSGRVIGMKTFGASAPLKEPQKRFGFRPDIVAAAAREQLTRSGSAMPVEEVVRSDGRPPEVTP